MNRRGFIAGAAAAAAAPALPVASATAPAVMGIKKTVFLLPAPVWFERCSFDGEMFQVIDTQYNGGGFFTLTLIPDAPREPLTTITGGAGA